MQVLGEDARGHSIGLRNGTCVSVLLMSGLGRRDQDGRGASLEEGAQCEDEAGGRRATYACDGDGHYRRLCIRRTRDGPSGMRAGSFTLPHALGRDLRLWGGENRH